MSPRSATVPSIACALTCLTLAGAPAAIASTRTGSTARSTPPTRESAARPPALSQETNPNAPVPVAPSDTPPAGRRLSANEVIAIAAKLSKIREARDEYRGSYGGAYLKGPGRWQVSYFSRGGKKEIAQVIIDDATGRVLEQWTGFQVAWTMARGYPGAFGRHVNSLYVWLPMCVLFLVPFVRWRKPFSLLHLDLLVLLSFSISLAFFNHGRIYASVPLTYPPLLYLLIRMLVIARVFPKRAGAATRSNTPEPAVDPSTPRSPDLDGRLRLAAHQPARHHPRTGQLPVMWVAVGVLFLVGFRVGLNVTDSNVIDVGYAGVIGAHKIVDGKALYGGWPSDNEHGDTYGPASYESYVPFQQIFGWSGRWDDLPAAHAAAIFFDLLATALMFVLGLRLRGPALGTRLAYAWVAYPFTLYALESNSNDTIVAVFVLGALLLTGRALLRGAFTAAAALTKFAPLALAPVLATHGLGELGAGRRLGRLSLFIGALILVGGALSIPALAHDSLHTIYERTIAYQANRGSPFSVWGLYGGLSPVQTAVQVGAVVLALALAVLPRRADVVGLSAACAASIIAVQLGVDHWFYLYIPWFFGPLMIAVLAREREDAPPLAETRASQGSLYRPASFAMR